jgi:hypothetical protein
MMRVCFSASSVHQNHTVHDENNLLKTETEALLRRTKREANTINRERERGRERRRKKERKNKSKNKSDNACANTSRSFRAEEQTFL